MRFIIGKLFLQIYSLTVVGDWIYLSGFGTEAWGNDVPYLWYSNMMTGFPFNNGLKSVATKYSEPRALCNQLYQTLG